MLREGKVSLTAFRQTKMQVQPRKSKNRLINFPKWN
ncbi:hypothetical protein J2T15_004564 [Paenibacillus harenae]|uniref:Uncharacterized protein n=1 Tax=Paenibacillus harenae TaxID=306543 RepID=A0ABT9U7B6_PAEHA|nr:hypothetical protein [Paenibacillus harenae]MDQ0115107.1 hypothetical protein [Paenibacillus harenae]